MKIDKSYEKDLQHMDNSKLKKIEKILLMFMGCSSPLINLRLDFGLYTISLYMASIIILFLYILIKNLKKHNQRIMAINTKELLIFAFFIVYCFSMLYSPNTSYGLSRFIKLIIVALFYFLIKYVLIKKPYYLDYIIDYSLISLSIFILYLAYKYIVIFNAKYIGLNTEYATGSGKNSLAFIVSIMLAFIFGNLTSNNKTKHKIIQLIIYLVIIVSVFLIQSRGLFLVFLVYIILSLLIRRKKNRINLKTVLVILLGFAIVISLLPDFIINSVMERFSGLFSVLDRSVGIEELSSSRFALLKRGLDLIKISPIFGVGAGGFIYYKGIYQISHNDYILVASEQGLLGVFIFVLILLSYLFTAYKIYRIESNSINKGNLYSMVGIIVYFLFINAYDNIMFWSILAIISAKEHIIKNQMSKSRIINSEVKYENIN